ncbi:glycoside hydrolase family protein [Lactiplantibacillus plantarum]|uniref:hypothetical protein n=1 Tax=Lactiplantibacillus plantarum TaxID=1590 RepID=UPI001D08FAAB|nr:hypothetical protein [Lactiplantibacillus plantarum]MCB7178147.1 hypothetical protein [Lactiplantibacillus plantarum]
MKRKRINICFIAVVLSVCLILLNIFTSKGTRYTVRFVDGNGVAVLNTRVISKSHNKIPSFIMAKKVRGYHVKKRLRVVVGMNQKITFKYIPNIRNVSKIVKKSKYIATSFQVIGHKVTKKGYQIDGGNDVLRIIYSNDGVNWKRLATNYPKVTVRDPDMIRIGNWWYIIGTERILLKTQDFRHWDRVSWNDGNTHFGAIWAPEFFRDAQGKVHIIISATFPKEGYFRVYVSDFDSSTGKITGNWVKVTGRKIDDETTGGIIDPHMQYLNGEYYLWCTKRTQTDLLLLKSKNYLSGFKDITLKMTPSNEYKGAMSFEAPETERINKNKVLLYFDQYREFKGEYMYYGVHVRTLNLQNFSLSKTQKLKSDFLVRHVGILQ